MPTSREIGNVFKQAREAKGLTIEEAARDSHILSNVVKDIETGVFDRLGKPYLKGFLKKYAHFLELDSDKILMDYKSISEKIPSKEFNLANDPKEEKLDVILPIHQRQRTRKIIIASLSVVLLVLIIVLVNLARSNYSSRSRYDQLAKRVDAKVLAKPQAKPVKKIEVVRERSRVTTSNSVSLTLKTRGEAWIQVEKGDDVLFAGILDAGDKKTFTADDGSILVMTGRGEDLLFTVNGNELGVVAKGVVKNIKVSAKGVQIGSSWVSRFE